METGGWFHIGENVTRIDGTHGDGLVGPSQSGAFFLALAGALVSIVALLVSGGEPKRNSGYRTLPTFGILAAHGFAPSGVHVDAETCTVFGSCFSGGKFDGGTLFKVPPRGEATVLHSFASNPEDGRNPQGGIVRATDGTLYGTTAYGGRNSHGTLFRVDPDGQNYRLIRHFGDTLGEGQTPLGAILAENDGWLLGTTYDGGRTGHGTIFACKQDGSEFRTLHSFDNKEADGAHPCAGVVRSANGTLYGMTMDHGGAGAGTVFRLNRDGSEFAVLHTFHSQDGDGANPRGELVINSEEVLFGTTSAGGQWGLGTVFRLNPNGTAYVILHHFNGAEGAFPQSGLALGPDRRLYGTTLGGASLYGTLFRMREDGKHYTILHRFGDSAQDGRTPLCGLSFGPDGVLHGTLQDGGSGGMGTLFSLEINRNKRQLYANLRAP